MRFRILKREDLSLFRVQRKFWFFFWTTLYTRDTDGSSEPLEFSTKLAAVNWAREYYEKHKKTKWIVWSKKVELEKQ